LIKTTVSTKISWGGVNIERLGLRPGIASNGGETMNIMEEL
jgi:hypothetical protein